MSLFAHDVRGSMESRKDHLSKNQTNIIAVIYAFIEIAAEEKQQAFAMKTSKILSYSDKASEMMWLWKSEEEFFKGIIDMLKVNGFNAKFIRYTLYDGSEDNSIVVDWKLTEESV